MKDRAYYESLFSEYPDVVTIPVFQKMMGRISYANAKFLIDHNYIKHIYGRGAVYLPKEYVIDYLLSEHYQQFKLQLKNPV